MSGLPKQHKPMNLVSFVRGEGNQSNMPGAKRAANSPVPVARKAAAEDSRFKKPQHPGESAKRSQTFNDSALGADRRGQHHPVQEQDGNLHISTFDTDGESIADTTVGDMSMISNQTYQNQPLSYRHGSYSPRDRHTRTASFGNNRAVPESSRYEASIVDEQDVGDQGETDLALKFTPADLARLSIVTGEFGQAHADRGPPNRHGVFESGASYPATSMSGLTGFENRRCQEEVESDQEHEQSDKNHDESEDEDEEGSEVDASTERRPEESRERELYEQQHTQRQPQQHHPKQHSDDDEYGRPLTNRGVTHQQQTDSGQGQSKATIAVKHEEVAMKAITEQTRKEQEVEKQKQRLEQEKQNKHWNQLQAPDKITKGQQPQVPVLPQGSNIARDTGRQQMVETKQVKMSTTQQSIFVQEQASPKSQPKVQTQNVDVAHLTGHQQMVETKRAQITATGQLGLFREQRSQNPEPKPQKQDLDVAHQTGRQQTGKPQQVKMATMQQHSLVGGETSQQPATNQSQTEIPKRAERKHASKQPGPVVSKVVSPSEEPLQLDYDEANLRQMDYSFLKNQPFDDNPRASKRALPDGVQSGELPERLVRGASVDPQSQAEFFKSLSLDDWEASGDWFMDQFTGLMQKMRQARREKRSIAKTFEDAVANRQDEVACKREELDGVLKGMKQSGSVVLNLGSTPQKTKKN